MKIAIFVTSALIMVSVA